jgi:hypothetical protein
MKVRPTIWFALALLMLAIGGPAASAAVLGGTIQYSKAGGIAGISESMKISPDGRGKIENRTFRLTATGGTKLAAAIRRADLAHTKSPKGARCCDAFFYSIRYRGHKVEWDDTARNLPDRISDLSTMLSRLYRRYAPS